MDPQSIKTYVNALKHGTEKCRNIRVQLVGHFGVGKSCLARKLMGKRYKNIPSTNGIDIHRCTVQDQNWVLRSDSNTRTDFVDDRLKNVFKTMSNPGETQNKRNINSDANSNLHSEAIPDAVQITGTAQEAVKTKQLTQTSNENGPYDYTRNSSKTQQPLSPSGDRRTRPPLPKHIPLPNPPHQVEPKTSKLPEVTISLREKRDLHRILKSKDYVHKSQEVYLSLWDFAGQFVYYATHHIFQTSNAVYLHIFDLSKALSEFIEDEELPLDQILQEGSSANQGRTVKDFAEMWVHTLLHYASTTPGTPPLFLIGTHKDRVQGSELEKRKYADDFFEEVRKLFDGTPALQFIQPQEFIVDNTDDQEDIDELRNAIIETAQKLPMWNKVLPARYILLEKALQEVGEKGRKIVTLRDIVEIDKNYSVKLGEESDIKVFLLFQHSLGNFVYLDEESLEDTVVLDPIWLIQAFKSLISSKQFCRIRPDLRELWKELQEKAILKKTLAFSVWQELGEQFYIERESILLFMDRLNLIAGLQHCDQHGTEDANQSFLVPSLLRSNASKHITDAVESIRNKTPTLCFVFREGYIPVTLFPRLLAACLSKWDLFQFGGKSCRIFKDIAIFQLDQDDNVLSAHLFCLATQQNKVQLTVLKLCDQDIEPQSCDFIRRFIDRQLEKELGKKKKEMIKVSVKCDMSTDSNAVYDCENLLKVETVQCLFHPKDDVHTINSRRILHYWFSGELNPNKEIWVRQISVEKRQRIATDKELAKLAQCIGSGWELIGIDLGVTRAEIEQIKEENKYSVAMQIFSILQKWKRECQAGEATFERIAKALLDNPRVHTSWDKVKNIIDGT